MSMILALVGRDARAREESWLTVRTFWRQAKRRNHGETRLKSRTPWLGPVGGEEDAIGLFIYNLSDDPAHKLIRAVDKCEGRITLGCKPIL